MAWDKIACIFGYAILQNKTAEKASSNTVIILKILSIQYSFLWLKYARMVFFRENWHLKEADLHLMQTLSQ